MRRMLIGSLLLAALISDGNAQPAPEAASPTRLFDPATAAETREVRGSSSPQGLLRHRLVRLNANELARVVPAGADQAVDRLQRAERLNAPVTLDLFPGVSVTARRAEIEAPETGGFIWSGKGNGAQDSFVTLVINDGEVLGHIQTGGRLYSIEPVSGAVHRVLEIDQSKIRDDIHIRPPRHLVKQRSEKAPVPDAREAATVVTIMVAHTMNARLEVGTAQQMQSRINLGLKLANAALKNSGALIVLKRVGGVNEIKYPDTKIYGAGTEANYIGTLCDLTGVNCFYGNNRTNIFRALRTKRNTLKVDLVVLMRKAGSHCGVAWQPDVDGTTTSLNEQWGYSLVTSTPSYRCIEGQTLAHEVGHNMGLNHDRRTHTNIDGYARPPVSQFNFGHIDRRSKFLTIMSYFQSCGGGCTRVPYFSTPSKRHNGKPVGIAPGRPGAADAARQLNRNRATIAGYR